MKSQSTLYYYDYYDISGEMLCVLPTMHSSVKCRTDYAGCRALIGAPTKAFFAPGRRGAGDDCVLSTWNDLPLP